MCGTISASMNWRTASRTIFCSSDHSIHQSPLSAAGTAAPCSKLPDGRSPGSTGDEPTGSTPHPGQEVGSITSTDRSGEPLALTSTGSSTAVPQRRTGCRSRAGGVRVGAPRLPYYPALDGLRAVAVLAVLLFHAGYGSAHGRIPRGVDLLHPQSGFLITSLLLAERQGGPRHRSPGGSGAAASAASCPPRSLTLAIAVVYGSGILVPIGFAADAAQLRTARRRPGLDPPMSPTGASIIDSSPTPTCSPRVAVLHFWKPGDRGAVLPPLPPDRDGCTAALKRTRRRCSPQSLVGADGLLDAARPSALGYSNDRIYFGTDTRAAELLGGRPACAGPSPRAERERPWRGFACGAVGAVGAVALPRSSPLIATTTLASGWLYAGGLPLYALLGRGDPRRHRRRPGRCAWTLARPPLVWLGRVSYGVYLYHWLIFMWLRQRHSLGAGVFEITFDAWWKLFVVGGAITLAWPRSLTTSSSSPSARAASLARARLRYLIPGARSRTRGGAAVVVTNDPPPPPIDFAAAEQQLSGMRCPRRRSRGRGATGPPSSPPHLLHPASPCSVTRPPC